MTYIRSSAEPLIERLRALKDICCRHKRSREDIPLDIFTKLSTNDTNKDLVLACLNRLSRTLSKRDVWLKHGVLIVLHRPWIIHVSLVR
jgi:hypothetical protein